MNAKTLIWVGAIVGGAIGQYMPLLWGDSGFSFSGVVLSTVGGIVGIWAGYKLSKMV